VLKARAWISDFSSMIRAMGSSAKDIDLSVLPPDIATAIRELMEINARQEALIRELHQALYGKKSETLSEDERQLVFEDLEIAVAEVEVARDTATVTSGRSPGMTGDGEEPIRRVLSSTMRTGVAARMPKPSSQASTASSSSMAMPGIIG
jgi:hypothetical protein